VFRARSTTGPSSAGPGKAPPSLSTPVAPRPRRCYRIWIMRASPFSTPSGNVLGMATSTTAGAPRRDPGPQTPRRRNVSCPRPGRAGTCREHRSLSRHRKRFYGQGRQRDLQSTSDQHAHKPLRRRPMELHGGGGPADPVQLAQCIESGDHLHLDRPQQLRRIPEPDGQLGPVDAAGVGWLHADGRRSQRAAGKLCVPDRPDHRDEPAGRDDLPGHPRWQRPTPGLPHRRSHHSGLDGQPGRSFPRGRERALPRIRRTAHAGQLPVQRDPPGVGQPADHRPHRRPPARGMPWSTPQRSRRPDRSRSRPRPRTPS